MRKRKPINNNTDNKHVSQKRKHEYDKAMRISLGILEEQEDVAITFTSVRNSAFKEDGGLVGETTIYEKNEYGDYVHEKLRKDIVSARQKQKERTADKNKKGTAFAQKERELKEYKLLTDALADDVLKLKNELKTSTQDDVVLRREIKELEKRYYLSSRIITEALASKSVTLRAEVKRFEKLNQYEKTELNKIEEEYEKLRREVLASKRLSKPTAISGD